MSKPKEPLIKAYVSEVPGLFLTLPRGVKHNGKSMLKFPSKSPKNRNMLLLDKDKDKKIIEILENHKAFKTGTVKYVPSTEEIEYRRQIKKIEEKRAELQSMYEAGMIDFENLAKQGGEFVRNLVSNYGIPTIVDGKDRTIKQMVDDLESIAKAGKKVEK